jgi:hypothetical protein
MFERRLTGGELEEAVEGDDLELVSEGVENAFHPLDTAPLPDVEQEKVGPLRVQPCQLAEVGEDRRSRAVRAEVVVVRQKRSLC